MAGSNYVQSVVRAIEIVEALALGGELRVEDLAQRLQLGPSTVQNLLRTLQHRAWVVKAGKPGAYRVGDSLVDVVRSIEEGSLIARARRVLLDAQRSTGDDRLTFTCTERNGLDIRGTLRLLPGGRFKYLSLEIMPPYSKPSTLAYQAFGPSEFVEAFRRRWTFENFGAGQWSSVAALDTFLAQSREQGVVLMDRPEKGYTAAAVPVMDRRGEVVATLGMYGLCGDSAHHARMLAVLKQAAATLSAC